MLDVTREAGDMIKAFLKNQRTSSKTIRILLQDG